MKTTHTAENWGVYPESFEETHIKNGEEFICAINHPIEGEEKEKALKRAKLIAASPDLLEACELVNALYTDVERMVGGEVLEMLNKVRAAINKATGNQ